MLSKEDLRTARLRSIGFSAGTSPSYVAPVHGLNKKVSSNLDVLEHLHRRFDWIPGAEQIRPSPAEKERKRLNLEKIQSEWITFKDYILAYVFDRPYFLRTDKLKEALDHNVEGISLFIPNDFPYDVGPHGNHYVLWFDHQETVEEDIVTMLIKENLDKLIGPDKYIFIWYENPKMTVPEFYHVQVFWIQTKR